MAGASCRGEHEQLSLRTSSKSPGKSQEDLIYLIAKKCSIGANLVECWCLTSQPRSGEQISGKSDGKCSQNVHAWHSRATGVTTALTVHLRLMVLPA